METLSELVQSKGMRYHIITYGCQMNDHESEKLSGILEGLGYRHTSDSGNADLILFNTCCIRDNAEQKVYGNIGALKKQKEENPGLMLIISGCMTQQEEAAKKIARVFPFVDAIIGTHNQYDLPKIIAERMLHKRKTRSHAGQRHEIAEDTPVKRTGWPLASVNIMYGCDNYCSYCIVPYVRGRERSRDPEKILDEIHTLAQDGYKEIMLLGQNVNSYHGAGDLSFPWLLERICQDTGIDRIRFMTSHPKDLSDELLAVMADNVQICKQIHLPMQSGSTKVLTDMNRGYTRDHYWELVKKIRTALPGAVLTTDIIVGFPGETEQDFCETLSLIEEIRFDSAFTFVYSKRSGTRAAEMENMIDPETQRERIVRLIDMQNKITEEKNKTYEGNDYCVLVEGVSTRGNGHVCGRTDGGKMVNFAGWNDMIGSFQTVHITQAKRTTLFGEPR